MIAFSLAKYFLPKKQCDVAHILSLPPQTTSHVNTLSKLVHIVVDEIRQGFFFVFVPNGVKLGYLTQGLQKVKKVFLYIFIAEVEKSDL